MELFEIYNATHTWKNCADMRPWIIVGTCVGGNWPCFPISTPGYGEPDCFELDMTHEYYKETGLTTGRFIHYASYIQVPSGSFARRRGALKGPLLEDFRKQSGV